MNLFSGFLIGLTSVLLTAFSSGIVMALSINWYPWFLRTMIRYIRRCSGNTLKYVSVWTFLAIISSIIVLIIGSSVLDASMSIIMILIERTGSIYGIFMVKSLYRCIQLAYASWIIFWHAWVTIKSYKRFVTSNKTGRK